MRTPGGPALCAVQLFGPEQGRPSPGAPQACPILPACHPLRRRSALAGVAVTLCLRWCPSDRHAAGLPRNRLSCTSRHRHGARYHAPDRRGVRGRVAWATVEVLPSLGTTVGLAAVMAGAIDIALSSSVPTDDELLWRHHMVDQPYAGPGRAHQISGEQILFRPRETNSAGATSVRRRYQPRDQGSRVDRRSLRVSRDGCGGSQNTTLPRTGASNCGSASIRATSSSRTVTFSAMGSTSRARYEFTRSTWLSSGHSASSATSGRHLSIVVLLFASLGNDPEQEYFVGGLTADATTDLSRIPENGRDIAEHSLRLSEETVDTKQIGRELNVHYTSRGASAV
jgi:hypothetical protein